MACGMLGIFELKKLVDKNSSGLSHKSWITVKKTLIY